MCSAWELGGSDENTVSEETKEGRTSTLKDRDAMGFRHFLHIMNDIKLGDVEKSARLPSCSRR